MFKFRSWGGRVLPRALLLRITHPNIRQSWEECQQRSPLTPHVKALQWSSDPPILLTATSRQPCSNGNFMDGVPLYRDRSLTGQLWEPDVLCGESKPIILSQSGLWVLLSGPGSDVSVKLPSQLS